jgi:hypothetical protein
MVGGLTLNGRIRERSPMALDLAALQPDPIGNPCTFENRSPLVRNWPAMSAAAPAETNRPRGHRAKDLRAAAKLTHPG